MCSILELEFALDMIMGSVLLMFWVILKRKILLSLLVQFSVCNCLAQVYFDRELETSHFTFSQRRSLQGFLGEMMSNGLLGVDRGLCYKFQVQDFC